MSTTPPKPKLKNDQLNFTEDDIRARAYEIWLSRNGTSDNNNGNPEDDWKAAIESLKLERSRLRRVNASFLKIVSSPCRLTQKLYSGFTNPNDRYFALDMVKTLISSLSLIATIIAGVSLYVGYQNA
ncbi:MAG: DUF2934 domain-containing protein [Stigonema ocellatum SAG 48.90 = DSM 106950]|nr:DUF2934 domain-containing protein [Stigonema ocellatum SAG 48.90 = DSM 106950]